MIGIWSTIITHLNYFNDVYKILIIVKNLKCVDLKGEKRKKNLYKHVNLRGCDEIFGKLEGGGVA
jgi:hypothetical protein